MTENEIATLVVDAAYGMPGTSGKSGDTLG